jgi:hypothetical protein
VTQDSQVSDRRHSELLETRREEALALFSANQAARAAFERVMGFVLSTLGLGLSVVLGTGRPEALLPLPAVIALLLGYMFQQYGDVSVMGEARHRLEDAVNREFEEPGLLYESKVARIRQEPPLVRSVRFLQAMLGLILFALVIAGAIVAFVKGSAWETVAYLASTSVALIGMGWSFIHMHRSARVTRAAFSGWPTRSDLVSIPSDLAGQVGRRALPGESLDATVVRLLGRSLDQAPGQSAND